MELSFVNRFTRYCKTRTDAPEMWHVNAALATVAVTLGNRVWTYGRGNNIYPNVWLINIGGSGMGKSVPLDMAMRILRQASLSDLLLPSSFSWEGLLRDVAKRPVGLFVHQEYAAFMEVLAKDYNKDAMSALTDFYDVPDVFTRPLVRETVRIERPTLTMLGASSPVWFEKSYKESMLSGGYFARHLFCPQGRTERGPTVDDPGPFNQGEEVALADHLRQASELHGEVDFRGVRDQIAAHVRSVRNEPSGVPAEFEGMRNRVETMVKKAAMLFHVSDNPRTLVITEKDAKNAIKYVERSHALAIDYLNTKIAKNPDDGDVLKLLEVIELRGGVDVLRSDVMNSTRLSASRMDRAERTAVEMGRLRVRRVGVGKGYTLPESVPNEPVPIRVFT